MNQVIYLYVDRWGVNRFTKSLGQVKRGEIPVKLTLKVDEDAFRTPVLEKEVHVEDWRQGVDIADIEFKESAITEEEAEKISEMRLQKMASILAAQGYVVTTPDKEESEDE